MEDPFYEDFPFDLTPQLYKQNHKKLPGQAMIQDFHSLYLGPFVISTNVVSIRAANPIMLTAFGC